MKYFLLVLAIVVTTALGVGAVIYGEADDAPGLSLLGLLFIVGTVALGTRTAQRIS